MRRQPEELRKISEALLYELQVLFGTAQALRDDLRGAAGDVMSWPQRMACIESFAIHARTLEAFVWGKPIRRFPDDVLAIDFFDDGVWESIRTCIQRSALDDLRLRAGYEIAHLSYKRIDKPEAARRWKFDVVAGVIGNAFRLFLENVEPDLLCDSFEGRLRATWPDYLNHPIAMSFPPDCASVPAIVVATQSLPAASAIHQASFTEMLPGARARDQPQRFARHGERRG